MPPQGRFRTQVTKRFLETYALDQPINSDKESQQAHRSLQSLASMWEYVMPGIGTEFGCATALDQDTAGEVPDMILEALHQPMIFRLNFIRQLSTTFISTGLGGTHTRLAHSLGTVLIAQAYLDSIKKRGTTLDPLDEEAVLILALVHDAYHGPFGHVLDRLRGLLFPRSWHKLDKYSLFVELGSEQADGEMSNLLAMLVHDGERRGRLVERMRLLLDKGRLRASDPEKYFLAQILDSRFDADRLDFIHRDSRHLGEPPMQPVDLQNMIGRVRVVEDPTDKGVLKIAFAEEDRSYLESTILLRRRMLYEKYYESPDRIAADQMLAHALYHVLGESGLDVLPVDSDTDRKLVHCLLRLTDDQLFCFLHSVQKPLYCVNLLSELRGGSPYRCVLSLPIKYDKEEFDRLIAIVEHRWKKDLHKGEAAGIVEDDMQAMAELYREVYRTAPYDECLAALAYFYYGDFQNQIWLERLLWERLLKQQAFKGFFCNDYQVQRFGNLEDALSSVGEYWQNDLVKYPHVHVALPSYLTEVVAEQHEYATEETREATLWHRRGATAEGTLDIPTRDEFTYHKAVISCPPEFCASREVVELIRATFNSIVTKMEWLSDEMMHSYVQRRYFNGLKESSQSTGV